MDVGFYLEELLVQQGEVKVPGLGEFSLIRMSAHYDEKGSVFHPPFNKVSFEPQADVEDNELAEYLVASKGISIESAQYFIEKYIVTLRQEATGGEVPLGNLGFFYNEGAELSFKPNDRLSNDPATYGFSPVKISKANAVHTTPESSQSITETYLPEYEPEVQEIAEEEVTEPFEEEQVSRGPLRGILIALGIAVALGIGAFLLYQYWPAKFDKKNKTVMAPAKSKPVIVAAPKVDSLHTDSLKKALNDTTAKVTTDTVRTISYELVISSFKTTNGATKERDRYIKAGLTNAKILQGAPGRRLKISIGSFKTRAEALELRKKLITRGTLTETAYVLPFTEQKQ
nr:hypothetical protein [uncultured Mucilaginibacter sp.]